MEKVATGKRVDWNLYSDYQCAPKKMQLAWQRGVDQIIAARQGEMDWPLFRESWLEFIKPGGSLYLPELGRIITEKLAAESKE